MKKYEKKKRELAAKGMPNPKVGKNVTNEDRAAALGVPKGSKARKQFENQLKYGHY